jgi:hypothetical protein
MISRRQALFRCFVVKDLFDLDARKCNGNEYLAISSLKSGLILSKKLIKLVNSISNDFLEPDLLKMSIAL